MLTNDQILDGIAQKSWDKQGQVPVPTEIDLGLFVSDALGASPPPTWLSEAIHRVRAVRVTVDETRYHGKGIGTQATLTDPKKSIHAERVVASFATPGQQTEQISLGIAELHTAFKNTRSNSPKAKHPLTPIVQAWQTEQPVPLYRGRLSVLPKTGVPTVIRHEANLPELSKLGAQEDFQLPLPLPHFARHYLGNGLAFPAFPLVLSDASGIPSRNRGQGAPVPLRMFVETLLSFDIRHRLHTTPMDFVLGEFMDWLWGPKQWRPSRHWTPFRQALLAIDRACFPMPNGFGWRAISLITNIPPLTFPGYATKLRFVVSLPKGSERGPMVNRHLLRRYGRASTLAYRAMLNLPYWWDHHISRNGKLSMSTRPEVRRSVEGYLLNARGKVVLERGEPVTSTYHRAAIRTGREEANPAMEKLPSSTKNDIILLTASRIPQSKQARYKAFKDGMQALKLMEADGIIALRAIDNGWRIEPRPPIREADPEWPEKSGG